MNIHSKVKEAIKKNNSKVTIYKNHRIKEVIFYLEDYVCVYFWKKRFPQVHKEKLSPRGDGISK